MDLLTQTKSKTEVKLLETSSIFSLNSKTNHYIKTLKSEIELVLENIV